MGRKPTGHRNYAITRVWDRHHEIKRLVLLGFSNKEIASRLGVTPQNISDVRNSPLFKEQLGVLQAARDASAVDVSRMLLEDAPKNLQLLQDIRDGIAEADVTLRVKVAQDLLDRVPETSKASRVQTQNATAMFTQAELEDIRKNAEEAQRRSRSARDAQFEVITKENVA